ncbi:uncharacterized protein LOC114526119 [Dendronephthya gigantea]|uniref:uncharacterized protein LOC114526119 n=1 Tax=Dendronephthya gigantea TaxID=151771 RepID=UPI0010690367|nr:uncharacterized protein LOC114526119 [Dendronephthya gigantea]
MASLNINSLLLHIDELKLFLSTSKIDILAINETKLDSLIENREIQLPGFELVRRDRDLNGRHGGGICLYVRSNINYFIRHDLEAPTLEYLCIEITKPRSKAFLVNTWYRPPSSPSEAFHAFEKIIGRIDSEDKEHYLLGDINCDMLSPGAYNTSTLIDLFNIYGLSQLIDEPTRVTPSSRTLIDLCVTNCPQKIVNAGVLHLGISDHSLVYFIRKTHYQQTTARIIQSRVFKNFNKNDFLRELNEKPWCEVNSQNNPNCMWDIWKSLLMESIDKHAPIRSRRVGRKKAPWITNELLKKMHVRNYLKKQAVNFNDGVSWEKYKRSRNLTNNAIKYAKQQYFSSKL